MDFRLQRDDQTDARTFGSLVSADGGHGFETLEPPTVGHISGRTCIPAGTYRCTLRFSPHNGFAVFGVDAVPGFSDVEIHAGNDVNDTRACILPGTMRGTDHRGLDAVLDSRVALDSFMAVQGVPNYRLLTTADAVAHFVDVHREVGFTLHVIDAPSAEAAP